MKMLLFCAILFLNLCGLKNASAQQKELQPREKIYAVAEQMPVFRGGEKALEAYFRKALSRKEINYHSWVILSVVIDKTSRPKNVEIVVGTDTAINEIVLEAARKMRRWKPARINNKPVNYRVTIPVEISKTEEDILAFPLNNTNLPLEQMPQFPGGEKAMWTFINKNKKKPSFTLRKTKKELVMVQFTVTKTGEIKDPMIIKSPSPDLDAKAIKLIKAMPSWSPGKQNGQPVDVRISLPIYFR